MKWFSLSGVFNEIKKIRWPKRKEMVHNTITVLIFILFFSVFFVASEALIVMILRMIGVGA